MSTFLMIVLASICVCPVALAAGDTRAQDSCRLTHHVDVDVQGTEYLNADCQLNCVIHNQLTAHFLNEGGHCPGDKTGVCAQGKCLVETGYIDVEVSSASVANPVNAYVNVCIRNHSDPIEFPLKQGIGCAVCTTPTIASTTFPEWRKVCTETSRVPFSDQSRVAFQLVDHENDGNYFVGGSSLTIPQLRSHGDSNKQLHLALLGGHVAAQVNVRVTWTPIQH